MSTHRKQWRPPGGPQPDTTAAERMALEDATRADFLRELDGAEFDVTVWEADFIESFLGDPKPFTPCQRDAIDKMRKTYKHRL